MSIDDKNYTANPTPAVLYVVATPIGNLDDISRRAIDVLRSVDVIAAEDTRHSQKLLSHHGVSTQLFACHEHNEETAADKLMTRLLGGSSVALISDAGTPLISDPGYRVVTLAHQNGIRVVPVPGASAAIAALCVSGLATDRFVFEGFLPAKQQARRAALQRFSHQAASIILYESCHRIVDCLRDMRDVLGADRKLCFARELTKTFETVRTLSIGGCLDWVEQDPDQRRGEIVLVLEGVEEKPEDELELIRMMEVMLQELPLKQAAALAAKLSGRSRNECYQAGLGIKNGDD